MHFDWLITGPYFAVLPAKFPGVMSRLIKINIGQQRYNKYYIHFRVNVERCSL